MSKMELLEIKNLNKKSSSGTESNSIPLQKYTYLYTCAKNNVAKYATDVSLQQM